MSKENLVLYPVPGDCLYGYYPPAWAGGFRGHTEDICDFAIWYGPDSPVFQPDGPHAMNCFATIVDGLDEFAKGCSKLLVQGEKQILVDLA